MSDEWLAYRLAVLCADKAGTVRSGLTLFDQAARIALMLDLALRDRLRMDLGGGYLDTSPTGYAPADRLLAYVDEHPTGSLAAVFAGAPVGLADLVAPDESSMSRRRRRARTAHVEPAVTMAERQHVDEVAESGRADTPAAAALAVIAGVVQLTATDHRGPLIAAAGRSRWLLIECVDYLTALRARLGMVAAVPTSQG